MKDYEINDATLAILPDEKGCSIVLEEDYKYEIDNNPMKILDYSCKYFGSSYPGRKAGSKSILNSHYKLPILVEESQNLVFFPTVSPDDENCVWISLNKVKKYKETDDGTNNTYIEFKNGESIIIDVSCKSFENQLLRASRLDSVLRNRKR